jgi:hypothetical protein
MTFSFGDDGGKGRGHSHIRARAVPQSQSNTSPRNRYVSSHFNTHIYALCTPHPRLISLIISLVLTHSYYQINIISYYLPSLGQPITM